MADVQTLRKALLQLHQELLAAQRIQAERFGGRMSAGDVLQAAADGMRFAWLRTLSGVITSLDEAVAEADPEAVEAAVGQARTLLAPPDPSTAFGARYLKALQDEPAVVFAHRDVVAALGRG